MDEFVHRLTSEPKLKLSHLLSQPMSPEELAIKMSMTRQAVDKHIKEMLSYGILEKIWVTSGMRPRVEFKLSSVGSYFYETLTSFTEDYRSRGLEDLENRIKALDLLLINGDISQNRYYEMRRDLEQSMQWFQTSRK